MDLVILLMWGRIWVALLVQSPQIHLHTFTHTHISVCTQEVHAAEGGERRGLYHEMQGWTLSKRWDYIFSRCISPQFPAGARIQRFGGKSVDSTSGLSSGFFPRMAKRPQCSTQSTSA